MVADIGSVQESNEGGSEMKIEKTTPPLPASQIGETTPKSTHTRTSGNAASNTSETSVHLGTSTAQLRKLESSIASTPVVDQAKVEAIKQAISEGRFQVNSATVADQLVASVKDMISNNKYGSN